MLLPISAVIPTAQRPAVLKRTLQSLYEGSAQPAEIILVDRSDSEEFSLTARHIENWQGENVQITHLAASTSGAAAQRNEGIAHTTQEHLLFMDDDVILEPDCLEKVWNCLEAEQDAGAASAMISNQKYHSPGFISSRLFAWFAGEKLASYAGRCIGPACNILPSDQSTLPAHAKIDWLNAGCTIYKKNILPEPVFDSHFQGASICEDLALSLRVGKTHSLYNVREALLFHDSQPGSHKSSASKNTAMKVRNRRYILNNIIADNSLKTKLQLAALSLWENIGTLHDPKEIARFPQRLYGVCCGLFSKIETVS